MIVIERLDLGRRQATVRLLAAAPALQQDAEARLRPPLLELGCESVRWIPPAGRPRTRQLGVQRGGAGTRGGNGSPPVTATALAAAGLVHSYRLEGGVPVYVGRTLHQRESLEVLAAYIDLLLATLAVPAQSLRALRLALYEICANTIEHGRPLGKDATLEVGLRGDTRTISGWIADGCECFDLLARPLVPLPARARQGSRRGYGIAIIRATLSDLSHHFDGTGNRLGFRLEVGS